MSNVKFMRLLIGSAFEFAQAFRILSDMQSTPIDFLILNLEIDT